jgi:hypothetical protein
VYVFTIAPPPDVGSEELAEKTSVVGVGADTVTTGGDALAAGVIAVGLGTVEITAPACVVPPTAAVAFVPVMALVGTVCANATEVTAKHEPVSMTVRRSRVELMPS